MNSCKKTYIICATQRSGSTLLCQFLASTRIAGEPAEYLLNTHRGKVPFCEDDYLNYVSESLKAYASDNGVSGVKMMERNFSKMVERLTVKCDDGTKTTTQIIQESFPNVKFIFISRRNKLRQALSLCRAEQTEKWHKINESADTPSRKQFELTPHFIKTAVQRVAERETTWQDWFAHNRVEPYHIYYEDLVANPLSEIEKILSYLEISDSYERQNVSTTLRKQSNLLTELWIIYYRFYFSLKSLIPLWTWQLLRQSKHILKRRFIADSI